MFTRKPRDKLTSTESPIDPEQAKDYSAPEPTETVAKSEAATPKSIPMGHTVRRPSLSEQDVIASSALAVRTHPMYVLPITEVLQLTRLPIHEDITDKLVEWEEGMEPVVFASQTWLSNAHPDNDDGVKLKLLQDVLRMARAGELAIPAQWIASLRYGGDLSVSAEELQRDLGEGGYVWFDIFSVPQRDKEAQGRAIASIMSYVAEAAYFTVVAGDWTHADHKHARDFRVWMGRGWCRVEQLANSLAPKPKPVIVVESTQSIVTHGPGGVAGHSWLHNVVGLGAFTMDADRTALGPVIDKLINARMAHALASGELAWYRVLHCAKPRLLEGTGMVVSDPIESLDVWLKELGYSSANDGAAEGRLTPLMCATLAKREDFLRELLGRGVEVDATLRVAHPEFSMSPGMSALHVACVFGDEAGARVLIEAGADASLKDKTPSGANPIGTAMAFGYDMGSILAAHPEMRNLRSNMGTVPMEAAALYTQAACLRRLLQMYPQEAAPLIRGESSMGCTLLTMTFLNHWNADAARACIEAGCDVNLVGEPNPKFKIIFAVADAICALSKCLGKPPGETPHRYSYASRSTALHFAAYAGNLGGVEFLMKHGADVTSTTHPYKMTPGQLAEMRGYGLVAQKLRSYESRPTP